MKTVLPPQTKFAGVGGGYNKFNKKGARMLDYIYHRPLELLKSHFWREYVNILPSFAQGYNRRHNVT